ncbi:holin [Streptomyces scopuliridis]|uniref:Holin n=1 Tax=Streptomyces scopuliridis TaxID=452529 RepID=A0ACD4ZNV7_9ACTN|nr:holin [Streptomyces scopuliridis]WSC00074.1 holin [Streptomyces scopuliridis]
MAAPVEKKVTAASAGAYVGSTGLLAALVAVQDNARLVEWMPDGLSPFVLALVPAAITFVGGWAAKHSPRTGLLR